jgi:uncharacterized protein YndB with AHSA1/START domain
MDFSTDLDADALGTVTSTEGGRHTTLRFERLLEAEVAAVWQALTDPVELAIWMNCESVEVVPGGSLVLLFRDGLRQGGAITAWDPPVRFSFEWDDFYPRPGHPVPAAHPMSLVTFELRSEGGQTRLVLEHSRGEPREAGDNLGGWHGHLVALREHLAGNDAVEFNRLFAATRRLYGDVSVAS